jgi:hypothetical protein
MIDRSNVILISASKDLHSVEICNAILLQSIRKRRAKDSTTVTTPAVIEQELDFVVDFREKIR